MVRYILINNKERIEFEKMYQLPFGCFNTAIYNEAKPAIQMLQNMGTARRKEYWIEKWTDGEYSDVVLKGEWLV
jgi:hypothetical protein